MGSDTPARTLLGRRFDGMFRAPPPGYEMRGSWSLEAPFAVATARHGSALTVIVTRSEEQTLIQVVSSAFEIANPCPNLVLVAGTCVVDGHHDESVFALMSADYVCGGHGESSPVRAWRVVEGEQRQIDPEGVTCGSISCEVDLPP
jgi:hypothetical protein